MKFEKNSNDRMFLHKKDKLIEKWFSTILKLGRWAKLKLWVAPKSKASGKKTGMRGRLVGFNTGLNFYFFLLGKIWSLVYWSVDPDSVKLPWGWRRAGPDLWIWRWTRGSGRSARRWRRFGWMTARGKPWRIPWRSTREIGGSTGGQRRGRRAGHPSSGRWVQSDEAEKK